MLIANTEPSQPQNYTSILTTTDAPRLLLILTEFPPSFGGMQTHALAFCHWLISQGYYIEVVTYRLEQGPASLPAFPFPVHRILSRIAYRSNLDQLVRLARLMRANLIYSSTVYYGDLSSRLNLPVLCRSAGNDVLRPWIAWPFAWLSSFFAHPTVERKLFRPWRKWQWPQHCEHFLLSARTRAMVHSARQMSHIFPNSHFTSGLLRALPIPDDRLTLLPGGVDCAFFATPEKSRAQLGLCPDTRYLLTACRLVEKKGLDTLLHALVSLPVHLLIAGDGPYLTKLQQLVQQLNLAHRVTLLGYLPPESLRDYLHAADLFVLSSHEVVHPRSGQRDIETMGRVLCEAAAAARPIIATRSGGIPTIIQHKHSGLLVPPRSPGRLAAAISQLLANPALAHRLATRARQHAQRHFDWSVLFAAHGAAIHRLLRRTDAPAQS